MLSQSRYYVHYNINIKWTKNFCFSSLTIQFCNIAILMQIKRIKKEKNK